MCRSCCLLLFFLFCPSFSFWPSHRGYFTPLNKLPLLFGYCSFKLQRPFIGPLPPFSLCFCLDLWHPHLVRPISSSFILFDTGWFFLNWPAFCFFLDLSSDFARFGGRSLVSPQSLCHSLLGEPPQGGVMCSTRRSPL